MSAVLRRSSCPVSVTMPARTATSTSAGSIHSDRSTLSVTDARICGSASTTGTALIEWCTIRSAISLYPVVVPTLTTSRVITSPTYHRFIACLLVVLLIHGTAARRAPAGPFALTGRDLRRYTRDRPARRLNGEDEERRSS